MNRSRNLLMLVLIAPFLLLSCTPTKKLKFVVEPAGVTGKNDFFNDRSEKTIQPYDYLYIRIFSLDERTNNIFNDRYGSVYQTELLSYAVDDKGTITLPFMGSVLVKDLTINQAKERIEKSLAAYLNNISVVVRYVSNKITILGEVNQPGQFAFYDEKITAFQALGFANGTNTYADLTNVTLIREKDNKINYHYLDLTQKNIVASEFYYLLPNDVIIINPINAKYRSLRDYTLNVIATVVGSLATALNAISIAILITQ
jgi:polysaccharide export outer membrane protein